MSCLLPSEARKNKASGISQGQASNHLLPALVLKPPAPAHASRRRQDRARERSWGWGTRARQLVWALGARTEYLHPEVWLAAADASARRGSRLHPALGITSRQGRPGAGVGLGHLKGPCSWFSLSFLGLFLSCGRLSLQLKALQLIQCSGMPASEPAGSAGMKLGGGPRPRAAAGGGGAELASPPSGWHFPSGWVRLCLSRPACAPAAVPPLKRR